MTIPVEPRAATRQVAKDLYGMYVALQAEGFTAQEALHLVAEMVRVVIRGGCSE